MIIRVFFVLVLIINTVPSLQAQYLRLKPFLGIQKPISRLTSNEYGYSTFNSGTFANAGDNMGILLEYQSKGNWGIASGITVGEIGLTYDVSYRNPGAYISRIDFSHSTGNNLNRIPLLFNYTWKNVRLFQLRKYRNLPKDQRPTAIDKNIFYLLLFKVQPVVGLSIDYIGQMARWDEPEDTIGIRINTHYLETYNPVKQLHTINVSAVFGVNLQFYSKGKDRLALSILYYQGFRDMLEMNVDYTVAGEAYQSSLRTRGSGLSFTLSYPIRVFTLDKEERALRRESK